MMLRLLRAASSTTNNLFHKIPSTSLFYTLCRKRQHFHFPPPPVAKKLPFAAAAHGDTWNDPYRWTSNITDPDFIGCITQENSYANAFMRDTQELQKILYSEMLSRMPPNITTPPEIWGPWFVISLIGANRHYSALYFRFLLYYQCIPERKECPILYRKAAVESKGWVERVLSSFRGGFRREQVLLDWNQIAGKHGKWF